MWSLTLQSQEGHKRVATLTKECQISQRLVPIIFRIVLGPSYSHWLYSADLQLFIKQAIAIQIIPLPSSQQALRTEVQGHVLLSPKITLFAPSKIRTLSL